MNSTYDPLVGHVLDGRYEILAKLARGGMATVYRARDRRLGRTVAVKVMRPDLGEDDEFTSKFDREARAAAALDHAGVVGVFDQGTSEGRPYIVMEYVEGETLRRLISREAPLPPSEAFEILEPIASALASAHEVGLIHRDIKPENVLISARGQVKVADFGLARQVTSPQMTATGVLVGTASYLPPELVTHSRPDARSDVYSTGVVLFEMLTGCKPHTGENNYQIAYRHVNVDIEPPSVRFTGDGRQGWRIPDYVDAFVQACTTRDPANRFADGRELLVRLREVRAELAENPNRDNPALAARLRPVVSADADLTQPIAPRTIPRPLESPAGESGGSLNGWYRVQGPPPGQPAAGAAHPSPVPPHPTNSVEGPQPQRTPVFPHLQISHSAVHRRRRGIVALILVLLLATGAGVGSWWFAAGRFTVVPVLAGLTEADALGTAEANDLQGKRQEAYSEDVPKGTVIRTDPEAGQRVVRNSVLAIFVSLGPERYEMPAVVGQTLDRARTLIADQNLAVGNVGEAWSEDVAPGIIISASQDAGASLKRGTVIDMQVSKGPEPIAITDFTGQDAAAATEQLTKAGFEVKATQENSATIAAGLVIRQTPASGTGHRKDVIELVSSLGPVMVPVPDVAYKNRKEAEKILQDQGFKVKVQYLSDFPLKLEVASGTDPGAGTPLPQGSEVTLLVS